MTKPAKAAKQSARKRSTKKSSPALATCPVGAHGWCSFPFSVNQLQKRLKKIADTSNSPTQELAAAGKSR